MNGRQTLFLRVASNDDADGDGLSDADELFITGTDPGNPDTGYTGIPDGYKDLDGDQWTNVDEIRKGSNPNAWTTPPAPSGLQLASYVPDTSASLHWEPSPGVVLEYVIERRGVDAHGYPEGFLEITRVPGNLTEWIDTAPADSPQFLNHLAYRISARYAGGYSETSVAVSPETTHAELHMMVVRGPGGRLYLVTSKIPPTVTAFRIRKSAAAGYYPRFSLMPGEEEGTIEPTTSGYIDVPAAALQNGVYQLPLEDFPSYGSYLIYVRPFTANGLFGEEREVFETSACSIPLMQLSLK